MSDGMNSLQLGTLVEAMDAFRTRLNGPMQPNLGYARVAYLEIECALGVQEHQRVLRVFVGDEGATSPCMQAANFVETEEPPPAEGEIGTLLEELRGFADEAASIIGREGENGASVVGTSVRLYSPFYGYSCPYVRKCEKHPDSGKWQCHIYYTYGGQCRSYWGSACTPSHPC
jgi:hypothetical protein